MKMLIGLTGKTGSGKTSAAKVFENCGAFVADCDKIAHEVICEETVKEKILNEFSEAVFDTDGNVNRKKLGEIVFSDKEKLAALNTIMHGAIIEKSLYLCENSGKDICIIDGSELEASGVHEKCAHVIVITADEDVRLNRIMSRDKIDRESALKRIRAQKDFGSDAIFINNNGDSEFLKKEITNLYNYFMGEINDRL